MNNYLRKKQLKYPKDLTVSVQLDTSQMITQNTSYDQTLQPAFIIKETLHKLPQHYYQSNASLNMTTTNSSSKGNIAQTKQIHNTMEDKRFCAEDMRFMSFLRSRDSNVASQRKDSQPSAPPSFYQDDIEKYKLKFRKSIEQRKEFKQLIQKDRVFASDTENINNKRSRYYIDPDQSIISSSKAQGDILKPPKRLPSRQSNTNFTSVDIDYYGNSRQIEHLFKKRDSGSPNKSQVQYEVGLRNYRCKTNFVANTPWKYIPTSKVYESQDNLNVTASQNDSTYYKNSNAFLISKSFDSRKYSDKFRDKNMNELKHLFKDKKVGLNDIIWESHLREGMKRQHIRKKSITVYQPKSKKEM